MVDPQALLDAYAEQIVDVESDFGVFEPIKRADAAEAAIAALRAVLDWCNEMDTVYGDRNGFAHVVRGRIATALEANSG